MALFHTTVLDNQIKALSTIGTASGSIATFETDKAERLVNLEVAITATGGGGTPVSPIAINGFSACDLSVNGTTETIPFGQTVYGGRLNVGSGVLTVTHGYIELNGTENLSEFQTNRWLYNTGIAIVSSFLYQDKEKCSHFAVANTSSWSGLPEDCFMAAGGSYIGIGYTGDFNAYALAQYNNGTPIQFALLLTNPTTIQLSSVDVQSIIGTNNIYSDTGDIIDLKFILSVGQAIS